MGAISMEPEVNRSKAALPVKQPLRVEILQPVQSLAFSVADKKLSGIRSYRKHLIFEEKIFGKFILIFCEAVWKVFGEKQFQYFTTGSVSWNLCYDW